MPDKHYTSREIFSYFMGGASEGEAADLERHLAGCDRCVVRARLEYKAATAPVWWAPQRPRLGPIPPVPPAGPPVGGTPPAASRASVIAQVFGALALVLYSTMIILPRFHGPQSTHEPATAQGRALPPPNHVDWPFEAIFEFRLISSAETHRLMFPRHPGVHLSRDYDYSVHFIARRSGWILLFSMDRDRGPSLLFPSGGASDQIPHLEAGQTVRFPAEPAWEPISAVSGRRELYAVYLDSVATAQELVNESRLSDASGQRAEGLTRKLDEMVVADGCTSVDRPCVLTFEYEVF